MSQAELAGDIMSQPRGSERRPRRQKLSGLARSDRKLAKGGRNRTHIYHSARLDTVSPLIRSLSNKAVRRAVI